MTTGTPNVVPAIRLSDVSISYESPQRPYVAVDGVDLEIPPGRFISVVGPTGCGKSTLLGAIAGLLTPSRGVISIAGTPLRGLNKHVGFMFQQDSLLPWKTLLENVSFGLQLRGVRKREREKRAREWINLVGLTGFENAYPYQLSGGMRKRTSVAQTWIVEPDVLLMDEPFAALDVQTRQIMENELLNIWTGSGKSVTFVTHDLDEAVSLADEVILLSAGPASKVAGRYEVDLGRPRDLMSIRTDPHFTEIYSAIWNDLKKEVSKTYERSTTTSQEGSR